MNFFPRFSGFMCRLLIAALFIAVLFTACSPRDTGSRPVTLNLFADPSILPDMLRPHLDRFEREHNVRVNIVLNEEAQLWSRTGLELAAPSTELDVIMGHTNFIPSQISAGFLEPLDNHLRSVPTFNYSDWSSGVMDAVSRDGVLYALPMYHNCFILYYRADLFAKHNIKLPTTYDELATAARTIMANEQGMYGFATRSLNAALFFSSFLAGYGGTFFNASGVPNIDSPEGIRALETYVNLQTTYGPPGVASYSFSELQNDFMQGRLAIVMDAYHPSIRAQDPAQSPLVHDKIGYGMVPGVVQRLAPNFTWALIVPANSRNKELAAKLAAFIMTPEVAADINLSAPRQVFTKAFGYPAYSGYAESRPAAEVMAVALDNSSANIFPRNEHTPEVNALIAAAIQAALIGEKTPAQALRDANVLIRAIYGL